MKKRLLSILLSVCMIASVLPATSVSAATMSAGDEHTDCTEYPHGHFHWLFIYDGRHRLCCDSCESSYTETDHNHGENQSCTICNPPKAADITLSLTEEIEVGDTPQDVAGKITGYDKDTVDVYVEIRSTSDYQLVDAIPDLTSEYGFYVYLVKKDLTKSFEAVPTFAQYETPIGTQTAYPGVYNGTLSFAGVDDSYSYAGYWDDFNNFLNTYTFLEKEWLFNALGCTFFTTINALNTGSTGTGGTGGTTTGPTKYSGDISLSFSTPLAKGDTAAQICEKLTGYDSSIMEPNVYIEDSSTYSYKGSIEKYDYNYNIVISLIMKDNTKNIFDASHQRYNNYYNGSVYYNSEYYYANVGEWLSSYVGIQSDDWVDDALSIYIWNVSVKEPTYNITNNTPQSAKATNNGYVTTDLATAKQGATVTVTPTANSNYVVDKVYYNDGEDHEITPSSDKYTFKMPAKAVTVRATFKAAASPIYTVDGAKYYTAADLNKDIADGTVAEGSTIVLTGEKPDGTVVLDGKDMTIDGSALDAIVLPDNSALVSVTGKARVNVLGTMPTTAKDNTADAPIYSEGFIYLGASASSKALTTTGSVYQAKTVAEFMTAAATLTEVISLAVSAEVAPKTGDVIAIASKEGTAGETTFNQATGLYEATISGIYLSHVGNDLGLSVKANDTAVETVEDYTTVDYLSDAATAEGTKDNMKTLIANLIIACKNINEVGTGNKGADIDLTDSELSWIDDAKTTETPATKSMTISGLKDSDKIRFSAAGIHVTEKLNVFVMIEPRKGATTVPKGTYIKAYINDGNGYEEIEAVDATVYLQDRTQWYAYIDKIAPTQYGSDIKIELYTDKDVLTQTLTYSVNTYCSQMSAKYADLCTAIYNYGTAAKAVVAPQ